MNSASHPHGHRLISGVTRVYLADALMLPLGLIAAMYLTRQLGPDSYGIYTLAIVIISWVEVTLTAPFRRMTIQLIAGAARWKPIAAAALRAQVLLVLIGAVVVWIAAGAVARAFHEPELEAFLKLFAFDMPVFAAAKLHSDVLVGRGRYNQRAIASAAFWTARLALIILLVELGWSVNGALIGCIGASLVELCVGRLFVRPGLLTEGFPVRQLIATGLPLLAFDAMMRLFYRMDFLMLKVLGGSASEAAHYAAAQNLALIPSVLGMALSTVLLATLTKVLRDGHVGEFRRYSRRAIRFGLILFPFGATAAGCADELVVLMFGADYAPAGDVLGPLMFAAVATLLISVGSSVLFAAGHAKLALGVITPTLLPAIIGYTLMIPQYRGVGAAWVTCLAAGASALTVLTTVVVVGRLVPPVATLVRAIILSLLCYFIAAYWHTSAPILVLKLAVMGVVILSALLLLREADPEEREALVAFVRRRRGRGK